MINLYVYYKTMFLECQVVLLKILNHVERVNRISGSIRIVREVCNLK